MRLLLLLSRSAYRLLLLRFPRSLREQHGEDMVALFTRDLGERLRDEGLSGFVAAWLRATSDLVRPLPDLREAPESRGQGDQPRGNGSTTAFLVQGMESTRLAWRTLWREPAFFGTAVAILGAGIALNVAVFAIVNAYLVRPLPYPEADRVVNIRSPVELSRDDTDGILEKRVSWDLDAFTLIGDGKPELARGAWVTTDFLEVFGVEPTLGRIFTPEEGIPGGASVAVISYGLWQERYGGSPDVLGRAVQAYTSDRPDDAETFTIIGVLPREFWHFNDYTDFLAPLVEDGDLYAGRLIGGLPAEQAAALLTERARAITTGGPADLSVDVVKVQDQYVASIRPTLVALQSAVLLVFLIACANVAVLLLVRSARRSRELGVRRALGAGRARLATQLVLEGTVLAVVAGGCGLFLGWLALTGIRSAPAWALWRSVPGGVEALRLDATVVVAATALCALTGVLFGLVPLLSAGRSELAATLGDAGRGTTDTAGRRRARGIMVAAEIALSLGLLTGAGLMVQSAVNLQNLDLGFEPDGILRGQIGLRQSSYPTPEERIEFFETVVRRAGALPGVEGVGLVNAAPFTWSFGTRSVEAEDGGRSDAVVQLADTRYFEVMEVGRVRGRTFAADDLLGAPDVVVVSETLAEGLWPGGDPLGKRVRIVPFAAPGQTVPDEPWATVVGVVRDVRKGVRGPAGGDLYGAFSQAAPYWMNVVVRTRGLAPGVVRGVEDILAELDPDVPFSTVRELSDAVDAATAPSRFLASLFGAFAGLALILAVVGLYGVMAYAARQSRKDVAIRMALGADGARVRWLFFRQALTVLVLGLVAGAFVARGLGTVLQDQLHGVAADDPLTLVVVATLLGTTALAAAWLPAHRAAGSEPMRVLRED